MKVCQATVLNLPVTGSMPTIPLSRFGLYMGAGLTIIGLGRAGSVRPPVRPTKRSAIPSPRTYEPVNVRALPLLLIVAGMIGMNEPTEKPQPFRLLRIVGAAEKSGSEKRRMVPLTETSS